jgi:protoheme IX farnesyltransferase
MNGSLLPAVTDVTAAHVLHRWVAAVVGVIVLALAVVAWRTQRDHPTLVRLAVGSAVLFAIQVIVGGLQVVTQLDEWTQTLHLALGAVIWAMLTGLTVTAYYTARVSVGAGGGRVADAGTDEATSGARTTGDTIRAYIALTKPRIIELLLVTTVPAMVLATRELPGSVAGTDWANWVWLVIWTMIGGTLAAGSANAINCYLDRDIDLLMTRTRRRPLPAHQVEPERAVVFGIALGVISFLVMVYFVNLTAAFLTLLAIGFYVVVYTMLLKRSTPQNIVIGGAAGALPPVIGWAAVTGNIGMPEILLFLLVFYWTPPHVWALSLRIRKDYAAAGVPMLPVVKGIPETTRQIALYTVLMVAISLVLFAVGRMGLIYLAAAVGLGGIFLWQAFGLWRRGSSEEASTAGAIRLYKYSISYLSLLFLAVAVDALVLIPL